jgi:hypothetical protein
MPVANLITPSPHSLRAPFSPADRLSINVAQLWLGDGLVEGKLTCRKRHDVPHGWHGGDMGVLVATERGLVCPYCDFVQDWVPSYMAALADPVFAVIAEKEIQFRLERANAYRKEYQALLLEDAGNEAAMAMIEAIDHRIDVLQSRLVF